MGAGGPRQQASPRSDPDVSELDKLRPHNTVNSLNAIKLQTLKWFMVTFMLCKFYLDFLS